MTSLDQHQRLALTPRKVVVALEDVDYSASCPLCEEDLTVVDPYNSTRVVFDCNFCPFCGERIEFDFSGVDRDED